MSRPVTPAQALEKLPHFCAYQERSHQEVRSKLLKLEVYGDDLENIIAQLISDDFLNEERFAKAFAGGRFRMKGWGRKRIEMELKKRAVSGYSIRKALEQIDEGEYMAALERQAEKKAASLNESDAYIRKNKVARYLIGRGFEPQLVWDVLGD